jgi:secreted PhoX family phosphatase
VGFTYLTAEESWGTGSQKGRLFEVTNSTTAAANGGNFVLRNVVPRVSHEGLAFDSQKSMYFIDELNGGSIYKYVSANPNAASGDQYFDKGQTFVAKVDGGSNANAVGAITWEAITTATGTANAATFSAMLNLGGGNFALDGRVAANLVGGTDYQRPEDLEIQVAANGDERLYIATTTTNEVYMFNLTTGQSSVFANTSTIDLATGLAVGSGLRSPDNLAIDAEGNIYIIEDRNGGVDNDIWFAKDINKDGDLLDAGEGLARWASNGTPGSEFTGLYFDKLDPNKAYVNIQHPSSGIDRTIQITAVPEPETYAMLGAGLGMLGLMRSRRRKAA